ncbi:MAG: winged helix-turn-helix transcriptional regulator [Candidatus Aquicultorales bacterium]
MTRIKIAVVSEDEEVLEAVGKELSSLYFDIANGPQAVNEADLVLIDQRNGKRYEVPLGAPYIAILSRAADFPALRETGAGDYVLYPFTDGDLAFRVWLAAERPRDFGLLVDLDNYDVIADGKHVYLTYKEFELLRYLVNSSGKVVDRSKLLYEVWDRDYSEGNRTVDVHVRRLRAKLGKYGDLVETVRNVGYRFRENGAKIHIAGERSTSTRSH